MRDTKAFASLSSGLLARKGQARPAMRPQGFGTGQGTPDDLGWNDMGHDVVRPAGVRLPADLSGPQPVLPANAPVPAVVRQQDEIAREFSPPPIELVTEEPAPVAIEAAPAPAAAKRRAKPVVELSRAQATKIAPRAAGRKAAFTLRLDVERHLRLRLACAVQNRSAQQLVTDALDQLLAGLPDVERLAASLPDAGRNDPKGTAR